MTLGCLRPLWPNAHFQALTHTAIVDRQRKKLGDAGAFAFGFHMFFLCFFATKGISGYMIRFSREKTRKITPVIPSDVSPSFFSLCFSFRTCARR